MRNHAAALLPLACLFACAAENEGPTAESAAPAAAVAAQGANDSAHGDEHVASVVFDRSAGDDGSVVIESDTPVRRLGVMFDAVGLDRLRFRERGANGVWSAWRDAEVTWREGRAYVARAALDSATAVELDTTGVEWANIELNEDAPPWLGHPTAAELPVEAPAAIAQPDVGGLASVGQAATQPSWIVSRAGWGARNPDYECGTPHSPSRLTIHHTVTPTRDSISAPARMRQIQSYHIDSNGWCDIGYHFVIGGDGVAYQARKREDWTGAHVGGQNTNNVGTSYMGDFTTDIPPDNMLQAGADVQRWMSDTYGIVLNRTNVLGHRENPGQSTSCPGDQLLARLPNIIERATGTVDPPDPVDEYDVALDVVATGVPQRWSQGSSSGLGDSLVGEEYSVELLLTNNSTVAIRGVELGYLIESPWVSATNWVIESDYPARDRTTWALNSANDEPANPARDGLGGTGRLVMHAFSPGETKRVRLTMRATEYSVGAVDHPDVRAWLRNVSDVYGVQDAWDTPPSTNVIGRTVQDYVEIDVLDVDAWLFDSTTNPADTEAWRACSSGLRGELTIDSASRALAGTLDGGGACLISPPWTSVSTSAWDQLVIHAAAATGPRTMAVRWFESGGVWDEERVARFEVGGTGANEAIVVPLGDHPLWTGNATGLRIDPLDLNASGTTIPLAVADVYFQSSATGTTSTPRAPYENTAPVELLDVDVVEPGDDTGATADAGGGETDAGGTGSPDASPDTSADAGSGGRGDTRDDGAVNEIPSAEVRRTSCATAATPSAFAPILLALGALAVRRRRSA
jgi:hypothetical protein